MDEYHAERAALHVAVNGPMESRGSSSREITDDAIAFVDAHRDKKFFLWIHYYDPHLSYETHPEVPSFGTSRIDLYDGEIRFTDMHLGRLIAHLRAAGCGAAPRSSLTGDHGEGLRRARRHRARLRSLPGADQGAVHRAGARGSRRAGCGPPSDTSTSPPRW